MGDRDFQLEQRWLDYVYEKIDEQLEQQTQQAVDYRGQMREIRTSLWEEHGISTASANQLVDIAQQIAELRHSATAFGIQYRLLKQLQEAEKAPYFGRIDFHEEGLPHREALYIGIRSLIDPETGQPLVYDWRAPVSSMFYDYGLGPAQYEGPGGVYRGDISLKRQYRIRKRKLVYMFDNELTIDDEVLQEALGQHASEKMRTIVNTIQREQNKAIRNDHDDLLLVEGPAGSGKTSVALHRVAYLLYRYRDSMQSQNIVIFSPNRIFNDYISHVLPELGEENVYQTTFQDFAEPFLGWEWDVETQSSCLEALLAKEGKCREELLESMAFKSSPQFQAALDRLVELIIKEKCDFFDVKVDRTLVISGAEQAKLFSENYSYLPVQKRLAKIEQRTMFLLRPLKKKLIRAELKATGQTQGLEGESWSEQVRKAVAKVNAKIEPVLKKLRSQLRIDSIGWYKRLWNDEVLWQQAAGDLARPGSGSRSLDTLDQDLISFEDAVPLCYLKGELEGYPVKRNIRHVVVDEVQDYSPMQLQILLKTFPRARFTFVGDVYQSLNPYVWQAEQTLEDIFAGMDLNTVRLQKSYRSTQEIFHFCNGLLGERVQAETVLRQGKKPELHRAAENDKFKRLSDLLLARKQEGFATIAVICETVQECRDIFTHLEQNHPQLDAALLVNEKSSFRAGVSIAPVFLAKGLEFDAVLVPWVSAEKYGEEYQRRLLYVACSRALHSLDLFHVETEPLSPFIQALSPELYVLE